MDPHLVVLEEEERENASSSRRGQPRFGLSAPRGRDGFRGLKHRSPSRIFHIIDEDEEDARALEKYMRRENLPNVKYFYGKLKNRTKFYEIFYKTPLEYAIELENLHIVQVLVEIEPDIIYEPITPSKELPHEVVNKEITQRQSSYYGNSDSRCQLLQPIEAFFNKTNQACMNTLNEEGNSPLTQAVQRNCLPAIKYLLNEGADLSLKGPNGITPLCAAIIAKNMGIIDLLSDKTSKQELTNSLLFAIDNESDWPIVKKLLEIDADFTCKHADGKTALHSALKIYGSDFVNYLIEKGCMETVSTTAIESNDLETVRLFIEKDPRILLMKEEWENNTVNKNLVDYFVQAKTKKGIPLDLFSFASLKNLALLKYCLKDTKSRNINVKSINEVNAAGDTLLHFAVEENDLEMMKFLFELGANVCKTGSNEQTPLYKAVFQQKLEIAEYLLTNGAAFTANTALMLAIQEKNLPMIELLTQYLEDVNFEDKTGETPLNLALTSGDINIVQILVSKQADLSYSDSRGKTPLELSVELGFQDATKLFIKNGADPNTFLRTDGEILLHKYLNDCDFKMVHFLIDHGAAVNKIDKNKQCPLVKIMQMKNGNLMDLILRKGADPFCNHFKDTSSLLSIAAAEQYFPVVQFLIANGAYVKGAKKELQHFAQQNDDFDIFLKKQNIQLATDLNNLVETGHEDAA